MIFNRSPRRRLLPTAVSLLVVMLNSPANANIWQDVSAETTAKLSNSSGLAKQAGTVYKARTLRLDVEELRYVLGLAPDEYTGPSTIQIELPLPDGRFGQYTLHRSSIMANELSSQHPDIRTYRISDSVKPENTGRLDLTPAGFHAMLSYDGDTVFIDPIGSSGNYQSYFKSDYTSQMRALNRAAPTCKASNKKNPVSTGKTYFARRSNKFKFGTDLRTYRLAIATTGEFAQIHGGTKAGTLAAIVTAVNRINLIYERDLAVKLELVANNSAIIYTNPATDPFTNPDNVVKLIDQAANDIDAKIGPKNFDIGHLLSTSLSGLASFGVVCEIDKAEAVSGSDTVVTEPDFIDLIAHEIGHQFGADHTFNGTTGACAGTRNATTAYEPGSGSTVMSYAGTCGEEDIRKESDGYFHTHSLTQMNAYIANPSTGGSCVKSTSLNNATPVPNPGQNGHIPKSTPFVLTGSATDADGDSLSYVWEQYDLGPESRGKAGNIDDGKRPIFRSFPPSSSPSRTFPQISDVLSDTKTFGEALPTTNRDLNFRLTVRDGKGGVASEAMKLTVNNSAGPFAVTAPAAVSWIGNTTQTITWDVANTTTAPMNCANVSIGLSTDGGQTFATSIAASTPNDGSQSVTIPNLTTATARIRVKCATQPFFAVNRGVITITADGSINAIPVTNADSFTVAQDSGPTNLVVVGNDTDADGDKLTVNGISNISNGGTASSAGAAISYQPVAGFSGTETLSYTVTDGKVTSAPATITVSVSASTTPTTPTPTPTTPAPTPTPTPTNPAPTTPAPQTSSSGGGGAGSSISLLALMILSVGHRFNAMRQRQISDAASELVK